MFHQKGDGAGELSTDGQSLEKPTKGQRQRRGHADHLIGRQESNETARDRHEDDRPGQRATSSDGVAPIAEEQRPEWPGQKSDGEDPEGRNERQGGTLRREEQGSEDGRKVPVEGEVIPFERIANRA